MVSLLPTEILSDKEWSRDSGPEGEIAFPMGLVG
jgi:hypothetical protein